MRVPDSDLRAALKQALGLLDYSNAWMDQGVVVGERRVRFFCSLVGGLHVSGLVNHCLGVINLL